MYVEDAEREHVLDLALSARTSAEIETATRALNAWVAEHPEDVGMQDAYEQMALVTLALEDLENAGNKPLASAAVR